MFPILTHPERLSWIEGHYDLIGRLVSSSVLMQITAGSVMGRFGRRPRYWAERMLDEGLCHLLATDAHNTEQRPPRMAEARDVVAQRLGDDEAINLVLRRPQGILNNLSPAELPPLPQARAAQEGVGRRGADGVGQYRKTCSTDGRSSMKKLASFWRFVFFTLAVSLLVSNCMEAAQTNKPA